jgi:hypothetical protein
MVLSEAEIVAYYSTILKIRVASGQQTLTVPCLFGRHSDPVSIFLKTGRWSCSCGKGDLLEFEARRTQRDHYRRCKDRVLEIIATGREQQTTTSGPPSAPTPAEPETFQSRDARRLLGKIVRYPGQDRSHYQRLSHWPAPRFRRALARLQREGRVCWQERLTTAGNKRRFCRPFLRREAPSNSGHET